MNRPAVVTVVVISGILVAAAPAVVAASAAQDKARAVECAHRLGQLWKMQMNFQIQFGGAAKAMPRATGRDFWLALGGTTPPMIDLKDAKAFQCPVQDVYEGPGSCDFRGPSSDINQGDASDPVGADIDGNHGPGKGGNVLKKDGSVQTVEAAERLWTEVEVRTRIGPAPKADDRQRIRELEEQVIDLKRELASSKAGKKD